MTVINTKQKRKEFEESMAASRTSEQIIEAKRIVEFKWVETEFSRTDRFAPLKDHQYFNAYVYYRIALRAYKVELEDEEYPEFNRPVVNKTIKNALSKFQFKKRLTSEERKTIKRLYKINEDVEDWVDLFDSTDEIDLNDEDTIAGITSMETLGVFEEGRAAEILK